MIDILLMELIIHNIDKLNIRFLNFCFHIEKKCVVPG